MPRALLTGVSGQDGSYLAELLLEKGYEVHGMLRGASVMTRERVDEVSASLGAGPGQLQLHYGDLADSTALNHLIKTIRPDEVYNLGAQSHVRISFDLPEYTAEIGALGTLRLLDAMRDNDFDGRFYQASSSEMFGLADGSQDENTAFHPRSPYACAKVFAYHITVNYRESYGLHASNGILFNHESPRRGENFVTRKITRSVARILAGKQQQLALGNLDTARDWGYARDYVVAMWAMLQQPSGDDYVVASGESHTVREFLDTAFGLVGLDWHQYVVHDDRLLRPAEVPRLRGDATKARTVLGWQPTLNFKELVRLMVESDLVLEGLEPERFLTAGSER